MSRGKLHLKIDKKSKTVAVASSTRIAKRLKSKLRVFGMATRGNLKLLGIGFSGGRRMVWALQVAAIKNVRKRMHRYK